MTPERLTVRYSADVDFLELHWGPGRGTFEPTDDDRVLVEVDHAGRAVGAMVQGTRLATPDSVIDVALEPSTEPRLIPARIAAARLGISDRRILQLISEGRVHGAEKLGRDWFVPEDVQITPGARGRPGVAKRLTAARENKAE
ncbi:MAG: hypothetical protein FJ319_13485 [SAR202 cluster bacterium]|nr:hypothetical protein [SAR202 cluster bacterium]